MCLQAEVSPGFWRCPWFLHVPSLEGCVSKPGTHLKSDWQAAPRSQDDGLPRSPHCPSSAVRSVAFVSEALVCGHSALWTGSIPQNFPDGNVTRTERVPTE